MANILNLTPHAVSIIGEDGAVKATYEPTGMVARATQHAEYVGELDGVELVSMRFGETEDLPEPEWQAICAETCPCTEPNSFDCQGCAQAGRVPAMYYIVSIITANAAKAAGRTTADLLITADPVRDEAGRIIGCRRFALV